MGLKDRLAKAVLKVEDLKRQLDIAQDELDDIYKQVQSSGKPRKTASSEPSSSHAHAMASGVVMKLPDRIEALLKAHPKKAFHYEDIATQLETTGNSVRFSLNMMAKDAKVKRVGRGMWQVMPEVEKKGAGPVAS